MKTTYHLSIIIALSFIIVSFNKYENVESKNHKSNELAFYNNSGNDDVKDNVSNEFFKKYTDLKKYKSDVMSLYKNRSLGTIWYDENEINKFGTVLYEKAKKTNDLVIPYQKEIDQLFDSSSETNLSTTDADMLLSSLYIVYAQKSNSDSNKKLSYDAMLKDFLNYSTIENATAKTEDNGNLYNQYYKLQGVLQQYKKIEKSNKWKPITTETPYKDLRPDAVSSTIAQVRTRLYLLGDLKQDSKSDVYDRELMDAVMKYKVRNGFKPNYILAEEHIKEMNIPISDKVKTLVLNMERVRSISAELVNNDEYIMVNVP
ncbi:MAG: L,D-transpeptidase, partial [Flavobacterium sp.]